LHGIQLQSSADHNHRQFLIVPWPSLLLRQDCYKIVQSFSLQPHPCGVDKSRASEPFPCYCFHLLPLRFYACLTHKNLAYWTIGFFLLINHLAPSYLASPFMCWFA
jgi:hypothetical protein